MIIEYFDDENKRIVKEESEHEITIYRYPCKEKVTKLHSHDCIVMVYLDKGTCQHMINQMNVVLNEGDLFLLAPNTEHFLHQYDEKTVFYHFNIQKKTFEKAFLSILNKDTILSGFFTKILYNAKAASYILFQTGYDPYLSSILMRAKFEEQNPGKYSFQLVNSLFELLCIYILRYHDNNVFVCDSENNNKAENYIQIYNYIKKNYKNITLSQVAIEFNYAEEHLSRTIKRYFGMNFSDILRQTKLNKAIDLINQTNLSINNIALAVGYTDYTNFYKAFKVKLGISPSEYRKKNQSWLFAIIKQDLEYFNVWWKSRFPINNLII